MVLYCSFLAAKFLFGQKRHLQSDDPMWETTRTGLRMYDEQIASLNIGATFKTMKVEKIYTGQSDKLYQQTGPNRPTEGQHFFYRELQLCILYTYSSYSNGGPEQRSVKWIENKTRVIDRVDLGELTKRRETKGDGGRAPRSETTAKTTSVMNRGGDTIDGDARRKDCCCCCCCFYWLFWSDGVKKNVVLVRRTLDKHVWIPRPIITSEELWATISEFWSPWLESQRTKTKASEAEAKHGLILWSFQERLNATPRRLLSSGATIVSRRFSEATDHLREPDVSQCSRRRDANTQASSCVPYSGNGRHHSRVRGLLNFFVGYIVKKLPN